MVAEYAMLNLPLQLDFGLGVSGPTQNRRRLPGSANKGGAATAVEAESF